MDDQVQYQNPLDSGESGDDNDVEASFVVEDMPEKTPSTQSKVSVDRSKAQRVKLQDVPDARGIIPESAFSVETFMTSDAQRTKSEFAAKMRAEYEAGFMRIQGTLLEAAKPGLWRLCWASRCKTAFVETEKELLRDIGWTGANVDVRQVQLAIYGIITAGQGAARQAAGKRTQDQLDKKETNLRIQSVQGGLQLTGSVEYLVKERNMSKLKDGLVASSSTEVVDTGDAEAKELEDLFGADDDDDIVLAVANTVYRMFVKTRLAQGANNGKDTAAVVSDATAFARIYASLDADDILGDEFLPLGEAVDTVQSAIDREEKVRKNRLASLKQRQARAKNAPTAIQVTGLQGDSEDANGMYYVAGLRLLRGRPMYVRQLEHADDTRYYLYYDTALQALVVPQNNQTGLQADGMGTGRCIWGDGTWILGPSLDSSRCTAFVTEEDAGGKEHKLISPKLTDDSYDQKKGPDWMTYDITKREWAIAPGDQAPGFRITCPNSKKTMDEYMNRAIVDVQQSLDYVGSLKGRMTELKGQLQEWSGAIGRAGFKAPDGGVRRHEFLQMKSKFYSEQVDLLCNNLKSRALSNPHLVLPFDGGDPKSVENQHLIEFIIADFCDGCRRKHDSYVTKRNRFLTVVNRPLMRKAFYTWKFTHNKKYESEGSGLFAEQQLPWNVRHPRSASTVTWDFLQIVILGYVAFSSVYRISFNRQPEGFFHVFDIVVDALFVFDFFLNGCTAYYSKDGELIGGKLTFKTDANGKALPPRADFVSTWTEYGKSGWLFIDLVSILPFKYILRAFESTSEANRDAQGWRMIKMLRMLRLFKLTRLARVSKLIGAYEDSIGPIINTATGIFSIAITMHIMVCIWFYIGSSRARGWVTTQFMSNDPHLDNPDDQNSHSYYCNCSERNGTYWDTFQRACVPVDDDLGQFLPAPACPGSLEARPLPSDAHMYMAATFTMLGETNPGERNLRYVESREKMFTALAYWSFVLVGAALAGAWASVFQSSQMGSQEYTKQMMKLKEFCKAKRLPWPVRERLIAHYKHLYPERLIVDEKEIVNDLPPRMRCEIVKTLHDDKINDIPILKGLGQDIMTELCLSLQAMPVLKADIVVKEGDIGNELFVVENGLLKVTQHVPPNAKDDERVRAWIEAVMEHSTTKEYLLFRPEPEKLLHVTMNHIRALESSYHDGRAVTVRDLRNDRDLQRLCKDQGYGLDEVLVSAETRGYVKMDTSRGEGSSFSGLGDMLERRTGLDLDGNGVVGKKTGAEKGRLGRMGEAIEARTGWDIDGDGAVGKTYADSTSLILQELRSHDDHFCMAKLCDALMDGRILVQLLNQLDPTAKVIEHSNASRRRESFVDALSDTSLQYGLLPQECCSVNDLATCVEGLPAEQVTKQTRIVKCLVKLGLAAPHISVNGKDYMGPRMDEETLGQHGPNEFFSELAILPLEGGWKQKRTVVAIKNSMLYMLLKKDVEKLSLMYPDLKFKLADAAEDYERAMRLNSTLLLQLANQESDGKVRHKRKLEDKDPLYSVTVRLDQQESKLNKIEVMLQDITALLQKK